MERPNYDFNFDLDCTAERQKEMEEMRKKRNHLSKSCQNFISILIGMVGMEDRQEPLSKRAEEYARETKSKSTKQNTLFWLCGVEETAKGLGFTQQFVDMDKTAKAQVLC